MATFTLLLTQSPEHPNALVNLLGFAESCLKQGHVIKGIFCYQAGTAYASATRLLPSDETDLKQQLTDFTQHNSVPLDVCISAAGRRGVISEDDARDADMSFFNLDPKFNLVGLGELAQYLQQSDKVIQF